MTKPQTQPSPSAPPAVNSFRTRLWSLASILLPKTLQEIISKGLLPTLLLVLLFVLVLPLFVALAAAFWLSLARNSDIAAVQSVRQSYIEEIHRGFGIDELIKKDAANLNARLDYLQTIEYKLEPGTVPPPMRIYLQKRQRAELRLTSVLRNPVAANNCPFEHINDNLNLLHVTLGTQSLLKCPQTANSEGGCAAGLDGGWWTKYGSSEFHGQANLYSTLQFERAPELDAPCSVVEVEGTFAVYKDVALP